MNAWKQEDQQIGRQELKRTNRMQNLKIFFNVIHCGIDNNCRGSHFHSNLQMCWIALKCITNKTGMLIIASSYTKDDRHIKSSDVPIVDAGTDIAQLLLGLENVLCQEPHWGHLIRGDLIDTNSDGESEDGYTRNMFIWQRATLSK